MTDSAAPRLARVNGGDLSDPVGNFSNGATAFQVARLHTMLAADTLCSPRINALMMDIPGNPGIHHKFVSALQDIPGVRIFRKSGTWKNFQADNALVEAGGRRDVLVATRRSGAWPAPGVHRPSSCAGCWSPAC